MIISWAVLTFLAVYFLSAIFGANFSLSFWGNLERGGGVWNLIHFVLFFWMLSAVFQKKEDWLSLLKLSVGASALVSLLAIGQKFFNLGILMPQSDRVFSAIGNSAFLATYLIFNIFFAGYLMFGVAYGGFCSGNKKDILPERTPPWRGKSKAYLLIYILVLAINIIALFFTGTRGAWLGFLAGGIVFLMLSAIKSFSPPFKKGGWGGFKGWPFILLFVIIFLSISLFLARDSSFIRQNYLLRRLTNLSWQDNSVQSRLILWQKSWQAWQEKPILGWGPENFEEALLKNFDAKLNAYEAWHDRAHNFIFDYGVALGWLGLIAYLGIFAAAVGGLLKTICRINSALLVIPAKAAPQLRGGSRLPSSLKATEGRGRAGMTEKEKDSFSFSVIFISLFVAYLAQNFFIFDSFVSYLMLFFVLALIENMSLRAPLEAGNSVAHCSGDLRGYKKFFLAIIILAVIFFLYSFNFKPLKAAYLANEIMSLGPSEIQKINSFFKNVLALNTFALPEIFYQITLNYLNKLNQGMTPDEEFFKNASSALEQNIKRSPEIYKNYIALGWLNLYFSGGQNERIDQALALAGEAQKITPAKKDAYLILIAGYFLDNKLSEAQAVIQRTGETDSGLKKELTEYLNNLNK